MPAIRLVVLLLAVMLGPPALAETDPWAGAERRPGKVALIAPALNEEAWFAPGGPGADGRPALLKARAFRPAGNGPFNVAVINHGSPPSADGRPGMRVPNCRAAGGNAAYVLLPAFEKEGHEMFGQARGAALWTRPAAGFLGRLE